MRIIAVCYFYSILFSSNRQLVGIPICFCRVSRGKCIKVKRKCQLECFCVLCVFSVFIYNISVIYSWHDGLAAICACIFARLLQCIAWAATTERTIKDESKCHWLIKTCNNFYSSNGSIFNIYVILTVTSYECDEYINFRHCFKGDRCIFFFQNKQFTSNMWYCYL